MKNQELSDRIEEIKQLDKSCRSRGVTIMTNCVGTAFYAKGLVESDKLIFPDIPNDKVLIQERLSHLNRIKKPVHGSLVVFITDNEVDHMGIILIEHQTLWRRLDIFYREGADLRVRTMPFKPYLRLAKLFWDKIEYYI